MNITLEAIHAVDRLVRNVHELGIVPRMSESSTGQLRRPRQPSEVLRTFIWSTSPDDKWTAARLKHGSSGIPTDVSDLYTCCLYYPAAVGSRSAKNSWLLLDGTTSLVVSSAWSPPAPS